MTVGGVQKTSLIDYPGLVACVLFLSGCNLRCPFCHNPGLALGTQRSRAFGTLAPFLDFLADRKGLLDGVVISGGEPTIHEDLPDLCEEIKTLGFALKLDTNGLRPDVLRLLLEGGLVDYVAMDLKTEFGRYHELGGAPWAPDVLEESIDLLRNAGVPFEFRTTCVKPFVDQRVVKKLAGAVRGAPLYALQAFRDTGILDPAFFRGKDPAWDPETVQEMAQAAAPLVERCVLRGVRRLPFRASERRQGAPMHPQGPPALAS